MAENRLSLVKYGELRLPTLIKAGSYNYVHKLWTAI
jgi:hypothetical protein